MNKIRQANIPLRVPPPELLAERTPHVLSCIYSVFTEGYWSTGGPSAIRDELCDEGARLSGELCALMPDERDGHALAALELLHDSRRATRVDGEGALVPLDEQHRGRWDRGKIARGLDRLRRAEGSTGPYLPQAVIAAAHATAASWEQTDWATICAAYDRLLRLTDSPVVRANRALAIGFRDGPGFGLAAAGDGGARSAAGAVESCPDGAGRPVAEGRPQRRGRAGVSGSVGAERVRTRAGISPSAYRRMRRAGLESGSC